MIVWVSAWFIKYFTPKNIGGISIFPFIIVENQDIKKDKIFINHEKIHIRQQLEMLIIFFYIWYGLEFLLLWLKYRDGFKAYKNISFEQEAYAHEQDLQYLKNRKLFSFINYLKFGSKIDE